MEELSTLCGAVSDSFEKGTELLKKTAGTRIKYSEWSWGIEEYHRGLKQFTEVESCPATRARSQRNHIGQALRAFLLLEWHRIKQGIGWFEAKWSIFRDAVRSYLSNPRYSLPKSATAYLLTQMKTGPDESRPASKTLEDVRYGV